MKKILFLLLTAIAFISCQPSKSKLLSEKNAKLDSIANDTTKEQEISEFLVEYQKEEQAHLDSIKRANYQLGLLKAIELLDENDQATDVLYKELHKTSKDTILEYLKQN